MTATTTITRTTLMSSAHSNVYDTVNDRNNVADPYNPNNLFRTFVYKNDPWSKGKYDGYPYIIVRFPRITKPEEDVSGDANSKKVIWEFRITVRTAIKGGANNPDGSNKGVTDMNSILDDLHETFDSKTIKDVFRALKMYKLNLEEIDNDDIRDTNDKQIFITELSLTSEVGKINLGE
jgi:hypothetical protein